MVWSRCTNGEISKICGFRYTYCNPIIYRDSIGKEGNVGSQSKKPQINIIERGGVIYANGHLIGEKPLRPVYPEFKITLFGRLAQNISTIIKLVNADNSRSYTQHTIVQMRQRGFSERNVETIPIIISLCNSKKKLESYLIKISLEMGLPRNKRLLKEISRIVNDIIKESLEQK